MRHSVRKGFGFGLTSGIITTLGLIIGLDATTHSAMVVIGGILVIAIADALSDSLGMHVSQEYSTRHTAKEIWESTATTFITKFVFAITFVVPIMLLPLSDAIIASVIWGLFLIVTFSFFVAKRVDKDYYKVIAEHLIIAIVVIIVTYYVGTWVGTVFI